VVPGTKIEVPALEDNGMKISVFEKKPIGLLHGDFSTTVIQQVDRKVQKKIAEIKAVVER
jgi:hypothetical protein